MRTVLSLNDNWTFRDDGDVKTVTLPHVWNTGTDMHRGKRFYSRTVSAIPDGRVVLSFESVGTVCDVFMDGIRIGGHAGIGSRFRFDVSRYVRHDCMLTVAVDYGDGNRVCPSGTQAGINGDVQLIVTGELRFSSQDYASDGVYITPVQMEDGWYLGIKALLDTPVPEGKVRYTLTDCEGKTVASCERDTEKPNAILCCGDVHLWDGRADAYLYTVTAEALTNEGEISDCLRIPVGFRSFAFDAQGSFLLNGRKVTVHGLTCHRNSTATEEQTVQDMALILETGADAVRLPNQMSPFFMDLCDNSGLLVWADIPVTSYFSSEMQENAKQRLLELIKQNYNRPSVFCWGFADGVHTGRFGRKLHRELESLSHIAYSVDTTRPIIYTQSPTEVLPVSQRDSAELLGLDCSSVSRFDTDACVQEVHEAFPGKKMCLVAKSDCTEEDGLLRRESLLQCVRNQTFLWGVFADFCFDADGVKGLIDTSRAIKRDVFYLYKAMWAHDEILHICNRDKTECPVGETELKIYTDLPAVKVTAHGKTYAKTGKTVFVFPEIPVLPGSNVYTVYADGITETWTVYGV